MTPDFNKIEDANVKGLAIEIYDALSVTGKLTLFEILVNDIYCQIGEKDSFVFSVEVRGKDAEFFLYDMNFILPENGDFKAFKKNILVIIRSVLNGDYEIESIKFGDKVVLSNIIFLQTVKIRLYKSILYPFLNAFSSRFTTHIKKGKSITTKPGT